MRVVNRPEFLPRTFFQQDPLTCARELVGKELIWNGTRSIVIETEAYCATNDEASHIFSRPSARAFVKDHPAGTAYVYLNYGMYWLLNVLIKGGSEDGFVLFRALEPLEGLEIMRERRKTARKDTALCSGPGKLGVALGVTRADHGIDLCNAGDQIGFLPGRTKVDVVEDVRVGISKATELRWRFLLKNSPHASVPAGKVSKFIPKAQRMSRKTG